MSLQADLTDAQLLFGSLGWTKPAGPAATVQVDVVPKETAPPCSTTSKSSATISTSSGGDRARRRAASEEFYFSDFSVNHLTHVEISATVRDDKVLDIKAEGPSYDGKQFFQSVFSAGQFDDVERARRPVRHRSCRRTSTRSSASTIRPRKDVRGHLEEAQRAVVALDGKAELNGKSPAAVISGRRVAARA